MTDPNGLWASPMATALNLGGITRAFSPAVNGWAYSLIAGREDMPVNHVSFWDAVRFANWLNNGQPTGDQDASTTEDGAYTITGEAVANNTVVRNGDAKVFLPNEDEWYKAAYYDPDTDAYFDWPTSSDTSVTCSTPTTTANTANCGDSIGDYATVGSYTASASPSGTFDQGGNIAEWNESIPTPTTRSVRGESYLLTSTADKLASSWARDHHPPDVEDSIIGFRVARTAPNAMPGLAPLGLLALGAALSFGARHALRSRGTRAALAPRI